MNVVMLPEESLPAFLASLKTFGQVYVPESRANAEVAFAPLSDPGRVVVDYVRTVLPPKKFFFRPVDPMFKFSTAQGYETADADLHESRVIFGVHTCDLRALKVLDITFLSDKVDVYYQARRRHTALIGVSCRPDDKCFCHSFGADFASDGYDLFLTSVPGGFHVQIGTTRGSDMVREAKSLFDSVKASDTAAYKAYIKDRINGFSNEVVTSALPKILDLERDSAIWERLGERCLGCGGCSMVCPTCYCFSVFDVLDLDIDHGERLRRWDSCLFKEYATVAGGHNFRSGRPARLRQRIFHKHKDFVERYGVSSCVGCGRCITNCPAGIDFAQAIKELRSEASA